MVHCGQSVEFLLLNLSVNIYIYKISAKCHVQQFYILTTECISVIFMNLKTSSDYYYVTDFCGETVCLPRITNWMFKQNVIYLLKSFKYHYDYCYGYYYYYLRRLSEIYCTGPTRSSTAIAPNSINTACSIGSDVTKNRRRSGKSTRPVMLVALGWLR